MPKTAVVQSIASIHSIRFLLDATGAVGGLEVTAEVNYGTFGKPETIDVFPKLIASQRAAAQALYARIKALMEIEYLD